MESLGFSDATFTWSDSPRPVVAPPPVPVDRPADPLGGWQPAEFGGRRYEGSDFRWSLLVVFVIAIAGVGAFGYWLYQRPAAEAIANAAAVSTTAADLGIALPALETFNATLTDVETTADTAQLFELDAAARALFDASAALASDSIETRSAAASAAGAALDGVRLAGDTHSYKMAVLPVLSPPALETDPTLIELDEAARAFGDWQLRFDNVRTALPDGVLPGVTQQLDVLSGNLSAILTDYVEALRSDDQTAVQSVMTAFTQKLDQIGAQLSTAVAEAQSRVTSRIADTRAALAQLAG